MSSHLCVCVLIANTVLPPIDWLIDCVVTPSLSPVFSFPLSHIFTFQFPDFSASFLSPTSQYLAACCSLSGYILSFWYSLSWLSPNSLCRCFSLFSVTNCLLCATFPAPFSLVCEFVQFYKILGFVVFCFLAFVYLIFHFFLSFLDSWFSSVPLLSLLVLSSFSLLAVLSISNPCDLVSFFLPPRFFPLLALSCSASSIFSILAFVLLPALLFTFCFCFLFFSGFFFAFFRLLCFGFHLLCFPLLSFFFSSFLVLLSFLSYLFLLSSLDSPLLSSLSFHASSLSLFLSALLRFRFLGFISSAVLFLVCLFSSSSFCGFILLCFALLVLFLLFFLPLFPSAIQLLPIHLLLSCFHIFLQASRISLLFCGCVFFFLSFSFIFSPCFFFFLLSTKQRGTWHISPDFAAKNDTITVGKETSKKRGRVQKRTLIDEWEGKRRWQIEKARHDGKIKEESISIETKQLRNSSLIILSRIQENKHSSRTGARSCCKWGSKATRSWGWITNWSWLVLVQCLWLAFFPLPAIEARCRLGDLVEFAVVPRIFSAGGQECRRSGRAERMARMLMLCMQGKEERTRQEEAVGGGSGSRQGTNKN